MIFLKIAAVADGVPVDSYCAAGHYHTENAGFDLITPSQVVIPAKQTVKIDFGIAVEARTAEERPVAVMLFPRSSISKTPLRLANSIGLIDAGYRGPLIAAVDNTSDEDYVVEAGTRLFQLVGPTLESFDYSFVDFSELSNSVRGTGGFGSTGI